jgi:hypothetical protein
MRDAEPLRKRLQRAHVATAETWYRLAVVHYTTGRPFQAVRYAGGAVLLRPAYYTRMLMRKAHMRGMFGRALGRPER